MISNLSNENRLTPVAARIAHENGRHELDECTEPDTAPGPYYVSGVDGQRFALLVGPFAMHQEALGMVGATRDKLREMWQGGKLQENPVWMAVGTCRMKDDYHEPGKLNGELGAMPTFKVEETRNGG